MADRLSCNPAEWLSLMLCEPAREPIPLGIVLADSTDTLHVRIRRDHIPDDPDIEEILQTLAMDLEGEAAAVGAHNAITAIETAWSHTFRLGRRHVLDTANPSDAIDHLFRDLLKIGQSGRVATTTPESVLSFCRQSLPVSPGVALRALIAFRDPAMSLRALERIVAQDAGMAANVVKLANSALHGASSPVRSVMAALQRIGLDNAAMHIGALSAKQLYSAAPQFRSVWNHSISVAHHARQLCLRVPGLSEAEVVLVALIHDVGRLAILSVPEFEYDQSDGEYLVHAEHSFCGAAHFEIGANLLAEWNFPADIVAAVRSHHAPELCDSRLARVIFLAEHLSNSEEAPPHPMASDVAHSLGIDIGGGSLTDKISRREGLADMRFVVTG